MHMTDAEARRRMKSPLIYEKAFHKQALLYYYSLGPKRRTSKVAKEYSVSPATARRWRLSFEWEKRIEELDAKESKKILAKVRLTKEDYRKDIRDMRKLFRALFRAAVKPILGPDGRTTRQVTFKIESAPALASVVSSYEKIVKLDLLISGEPTEIVDSPPSVLVLPQGLAPKDWEKVDR